MLAKNQGLNIAASYSHPKQLLASKQASELAMIVGDASFLATKLSRDSFVLLGSGELVFISNADIKSENKINTLNKIALAQSQKNYLRQGC